MRHLVLICTVLLACGESPPDTPPVDPYSAAAMVARFRESVPEHPTALGTGATTSVDTLFARYVGGIATRDSSLLRPLALTVSEFAWLYYLDSPNAQKPYELDPDVMWTQISSQSARGLTRALSRHGGQAPGAWRSACDSARVAGALRLRDCAVTLGADTLRLSVVERGGRFKLVGFGTNL
jgi:hypothetical protein